MARSAAVLRGARNYCTSGVHCRTTRRQDCYTDVTTLRPHGSRQEAATAFGSGRRILRPTKSFTGKSIGIVRTSSARGWMLAARAGLFGHISLWMQ